MQATPFLLPAGQLAHKRPPSPLRAPGGAPCSGPGQRQGIPFWAPPVFQLQKFRLRGEASGPSALWARERSESVCTLGFCDPAARPASKRRVFPPPGPGLTGRTAYVFSAWFRLRTSAHLPLPGCLARASAQSPGSAASVGSAGWAGGSMAPRAWWRPATAAARLGSLIHLIPCAPPAGEP